MKTTTLRRPDGTPVPPGSDEAVEALLSLLAEHASGERDHSAHLQDIAASLHHLGWVGP